MKNEKFEKAKARSYSSHFAFFLFNFAFFIACAKFLHVQTRE